jgi:beta-xylosidase
VITTHDIFSGSWSQPVYFDQTGIDPDLFFDDDGCVYLSTGLPEFAPLSGNSTIWQSQVDITTGRSLTQPAMIYRSSLPLSIRWAEGPHLYKINGTYYLSVAEGKLNLASKSFRRVSNMFNEQAVLKSCIARPFNGDRPHLAPGSQVH